MSLCGSASAPSHHIRSARIEQGQQEPRGGTASLSRLLRSASSSDGRGPPDSEWDACRSATAVRSAADGPRERVRVRARARADAPLRARARASLHLPPPMPALHLALLSAGLYPTLAFLMTRAHQAMQRAELDS